MIYFLTVVLRGPAAGAEQFFKGAGEILGGGGHLIHFQGDGSAATFVSTAPFPSDRQQLIQLAVRLGLTALAMDATVYTPVAA